MRAGLSRLLNGRSREQLDGDTADPSEGFALVADTFNDGAITPQREVLPGVDVRTATTNYERIGPMDAENRRSFVQEGDMGAQYAWTS